MYVPSHGQSTTHDYTVPVNRGQYNREMPRRTSNTSSSTSQQKSGATTNRRYTDTSKWGSTPRTTSTTHQRQTETITSTTVRQNMPTGSSTRRDRQTTTTRRDKSTPVATSTTRTNRKRRTSTTTQDRSQPVSTSTTRRDRKRPTTTTRTYPKQTPNIEQEETSTTQTRRRRRSYQQDEQYRNHSSHPRTRADRTEQRAYPRQRQQESSSDTCYSSTTRVGLRGSQHALDMSSDAVNSGMGWAVGFQPCDDIFEMELSHVSFGDGFAIGVDSPVQLTAQFYGSTSGLAPFLSVGVHGAQNDLVKEIGFMDDEILIGMHGGLGLRYKAGPLSLTLEGRYGSYVDQEFSQLQGLAGVNLHF